MMFRPLKFNSKPAINPSGLDLAILQRFRTIGTLPVSRPAHQPKLWVNKEASIHHSPTNVIAIAAKTINAGRNLR